MKHVVFKGDRAFVGSFGWSSKDVCVVKEVMNGWEIAQIYAPDYITSTDDEVQSGIYPASCFRISKDKLTVTTEKLNR